LLVACVEAIARGNVRERDGSVFFDETPLSTPLRLDASGHLTAA
jgi:hypothetical protein